MTPEAQTRQIDTNAPSWENLLPYMLQLYLQLPQERKVIEEQMAAFGKKVDEAMIIVDKKSTRQ